MSSHIWECELLTLAAAMLSSGGGSPGPARRGESNISRVRRPATSLPVTRRLHQAKRGSAD
jgi:hypothetical protein